MAENGASRTDLTTVPYGVLKDVGVDDKYINLAQALAGKPREVDPAMAAFLYFSKMGELASQPGATLFGSAAGAASSPAEYIMGVREANRKAEADVPATAINLMKALKPSTAGATTYKSIIVTMSDGTTKKDYVPASEIASIKALDGVVSVAEDTSASSTTGAKKPAPYSVSEDNLAQLNTTLGLNLQRSPEGTVLLTPSQFGLAQSLVGIVQPKGATFERMFDRVNDIGIRLADPTLAIDVTQAEKNEYSGKYQKLISGGEYTQIIDGEEVTKYKPGIDLSETTNLPVPEGLDLDKIIKKRSQKFDQNQTKAATFGSRMLLNEGILRNVLAEGYELNVQDVAQIRLMARLGLGNIGVDSKAQQFHVAAQNWVAAQLREESGAAINPTEYADALLQYFPTVGDSFETRKQKQALREETTRGMINTAQDAFGVVYPSAVQYLKYTSEGTEYNILDPQGYANELLSKTELGQTLFFKDGLTTKTTEALQNMLANPNAENLFTSDMLDMIDAELSRRR